MRVLVTGATGYIGGRLIPRLLEAGHEVRVLVRDAGRLAARAWVKEIEVVEGDLLDADSLEGLCEGVEAGYYLVHAMGAGAGFAKRDHDAAANFCEVAKGLGHVIYLGGLLPMGEKVSEHLTSRAEVGQVLAGRLATTEFRAGPIIGSGSASFEMVRYLTERLPVMVAPRWVNNRVQPIGVRDVLGYLVAALGVGPSGIVDIGANPLTFREMMYGYAAARGLGRVIIPVPVLAPGLAARWVGLVTPIPNKLAVPLVRGMVRPLVGDTSRAEGLFPQIKPMGYGEAVERAVAQDRSKHG